MRLTARVVALVLAALPARTACVTVTGPQILTRDLARVNPIFESLQPDQAILFAPAPGTQRTVSTRELDRIAKRLGIADLDTGSLASVCFERSVELLAPSKIRSAMAATLGIPEEQIEIVDFSRFRVPEGAVEFPRAGLEPPNMSRPDAPAFWRGRVIYDHGRSVTVWAKVKVWIETPVLVTTVAIPSGQVIQADQVNVV